MNDSNEATSVSGHEENHHSSESLEGDLTISIFDGLQFAPDLQSSKSSNKNPQSFWFHVRVYIMAVHRSLPFFGTVFWKENFH